MTMEYWWASIFKVLSGWKLWLLIVKVFFNSCNIWSIYPLNCGRRFHCGLIGYQLVKKTGTKPKPSQEPLLSKANGFLQLLVLDQRSSVSVDAQPGSPSVESFEAVGATPPYISTRRPETFINNHNLGSWQGIMLNNFFFLEYREPSRLVLWFVLLEFLFLEPIPQYSWMWTESSHTFFFFFCLFLLGDFEKGQREGGKNETLRWNSRMEKFTRYQGLIRHTPKGSKTGLLKKSILSSYESHLMRHYLTQNTPSFPIC